MIKGKLLLSTAIVAGLALGAVMAPSMSGWTGAAYASDDGEGGQGAQGGGGEGQGQGGPGSQSGQGNQAGGQGQGGPGQDSDGQGPQAGTPPENAGGAPIWAQEGIPEVELGRLSVARSPDSVLARAYAEALLTLPASADLYNKSLTEIIETLRTEWDDLTLVDSPLANLALLKDAMDGAIDLSSVGIVNDPVTLASVFLGLASDKTVPISEDTVKALATIFEIPVTDAYIATLASQAEDVRAAVLEGHG